MPVITSVKPTTRDTRALFRFLKGMVLPKISIPFFCLKRQYTEMIMRVKVVILRPHAVEAGAPPININIIVKNLVESYIWLSSIVLYPAVLGLTT